MSLPIVNMVLDVVLLRLSELCVWLVGVVLDASVVWLHVLVVLARLDTLVPAVPAVGTDSAVLLETGNGGSVALTFAVTGSCVDVVSPLPVGGGRTVEFDCGKGAELAVRPADPQPVLVAEDGGTVPGMAPAREVEFRSGNGGDTVDEFKEVGKGAEILKVGRGSDVVAEVTPVPGGLISDEFRVGNRLLSGAEPVGPAVGGSPVLFVIGKGRVVEAVDDGLGIEVGNVEGEEVREVGIDEVVGIAGTTVVVAVENVVFAAREISDCERGSAELVRIIDDALGVGLELRAGVDVLVIVMVPGIGELGPKTLGWIVVG